MARRELRKRLPSASWRKHGDHSQRDDPSSQPPRQVNSGMAREQECGTCRLQTLGI